MKKLVRITLITLASFCALHVVYSMVMFVKTEMYTDKVLFCGKVVNLAERPSYNNKSGSYQYTNLEMTVNFYNHGVHIVDVGANTFYTTKVGEQVCFSWEPNRFTEQSFWVIMFGCEAFVGFLVSAILLIAVIGALYEWAFS